MREKDIAATVRTEGFFIAHAYWYENYFLPYSVMWHLRKHKNQEKEKKEGELEGVRRQGNK